MTVPVRGSLPSGRGQLQRRGRLQNSDLSAEGVDLELGGERRGTFQVADTVRGFVGLEAQLDFQFETAAIPPFWRSEEHTSELQSQ